ncbi:NAD(P)-dependent oxidoreductase (plasmid) [Rhodobacteraceae bacterium M382]|nr:NAD(P)-dependent oxidoreductase [Rhodobacteraceae bacterium M382]
MAQERIGLIGLGNVGGFYARNLLKAFGALTVYDRDPAKCTALQSEGTTIAASSADLAAQTDIIVLALPNPQAVQQEIFAENGILAAANTGALVMDISTIDPETATKLYQSCDRAGYQYLECPMSGGEPGGAGHFGAQKGLITFMAGGDQAAFDRAVPVFDALGKHWMLLGPAGTGNAVKLISNLIAGLYMASMAEGFVLGAAMGISHETLLKVFRHTDAQSFTMFEEFAPHLSSNDYEEGFPVELMHKDHRLAGEMARKHNVPLYFNSLAMELYQTAMARGFGRKSHAAIVESMALAANVNLTNKGAA